MKAFVKNFLKDRNEALLSLDKEKLLRYFTKYDIAVPSNEKVFWAGVHKARLSIKNIPVKEKEVSRKWLLENGFSCNVEQMNKDVPRELL